MTFGVRQTVTALAIAQMAAEPFRVPLDVTSNGTIIHPLSFLFLDELQLTMVFIVATLLLTILIKY